MKKTNKIFIKKLSSGENEILYYNQPLNINEIFTDERIIKVNDDGDRNLILFRGLHIFLT